MVSQLSPSRTQPRASAEERGLSHTPRRQWHRIGVIVVVIAVVLLAVVAGLRSRADVQPTRRAGHSTGASSAPLAAPQTSAEPESQTQTQTQRARDQLAARAMPDTGTGRVYNSAPLSTTQPEPPIVLPQATTLDHLGVATGFPRTRPGAIAQLVAIEQAALQSASLLGVQAVIGGWAAPGGPTAGTWSGVSAMAGLLEDLDLSGAGSPRLQVLVNPAMGLIKGDVGDDFTVACVVMTVDVAFNSYASSTPVADCQRMLWLDERWVIGPGAEPAEAPSVWPATDAALAAGYRGLIS